MWTVLRTFESEPEARVVEAFLQANEVDVQLLGTHSHSSIVAPGSLKTSGMRLMVRDEQLPVAKQLLVEQEARAHLSVAPPEGAPPPLEKRYDKIIIALILFVVAVIAAVKLLR